MYLAWRLNGMYIFFKAFDIFIYTYILGLYNSYFGVPRTFSIPYLGLDKNIISGKI